MKLKTMHVIFFVFIITFEITLTNSSLSDPILNCSSLFPKGFCENYKKMDRTYLNDENILKEKIQIYKENSKNGRIYLRKYFDTRDDTRIGPFTNSTDCEQELRVNYSDNDEIFCFLIVEYQRSYENLSELRKSYNIFIRSRKYYKDITDNYFDKTELEIKSLPFPLENDNCIDILSPIMSRFFVDKKQNSTEDFCILSTNFKRNYTTINDAWSPIDYFTKRKRYYIKRLFDKNPEDIYAFSSINECIKDFYWEKTNEIKKKFCVNLEKKNTKISISKIVKELKIFKEEFTYNFLENSKNSRLIQNDLNSKLDISYKDQLTCMGEIKAVMLKYFKNKNNIFNKINEFCINMILFKKSYENVKTLIFRLESFTKNMEKLKEFKNKKFLLNVHKNKFFDYTFDEIENYNPGYKKTDTNSEEMQKINFDINDINSNKFNIRRKNRSKKKDKKKKGKKRGKKEKKKPCYKTVSFLEMLKDLINQEKGSKFGASTKVLSSSPKRNFGFNFKQIKGSRNASTPSNRNSKTTTQNSRNRISNKNSKTTTQNSRNRISNKNSKRTILNSRKITFSYRYLIIRNHYDKTRRLSYKYLKRRNQYRRYLNTFYEKIERILDKSPLKIIKKIKDCKNINLLQLIHITDALLPKSLNYLETGIINPNVYDQGECGSCWVFSLAGMIESIISLRNNTNIQPLSRQYLLDCVGHGSCKGGNYIYGLQFGLKNRYYLEKEYRPYLGKKEVCQIQESERTLKNIGKPFNVYNSVNKAELKYILLNGPVPVNIDASPYEFLFYKKGILRYNCNKPNHSVLLVGWDRDKSTGMEYWIIRNSWGKDWGNEGNAFIEMDSIWDACGMYKEVVDLTKKTDLISVN